ncbi:MAG: UDP-N-acetylmuramoyl-tripeptide--D-alanyl-D-alanine ligase [Anaerolineae bacterium]|jgi:UDP-N-acetylmuramoyl-tripeptide--D-alanyl-D-alanine ligase
MSKAVVTLRPDRLTLAHLVTALAGPGTTLAAGAVGQTPVRSTVIDSRLAKPGCLFIALRGERDDGHRFIPDALKRGAVAVIAEQEPVSGCHILDLRGETTETAWQIADLPICLLVPDSLAGLQQAAAHWRRQHDVRVVGITGSIGKTMTKEVTAAVLASAYATLKSEGNYNNEIGLPLTLLHLRRHHECVVLEMGMYDVGEIAHLAEIARPQIGVVTNVGPSHLERLGTIERIAEAKTELPRALPVAGEGGVAILNADDARVRAMAEQTRARIFTYGLDPDADLWASHIESQGLEGIQFQLHYQRETVHAGVPLLGRHSVHTALAAAAVGLVEDLAWDEIMEGLADQSTQLRLVAVSGPAGSTLLDDTYNASPASSIAALNLVNELAAGEEAGRKIAVLGDMYELGSYEEEGHRMVGRRVRDIADILVAVGTLGHIVGREALDAGMPPHKVHLVEDNATAIDLLRDLLEAGDIVLVKGSRGMAMEEIVTGLQVGDVP